MVNQMKLYNLGEWQKLKYISFDDEDRIEEGKQKYGLKEKFLRLISGKGWSFLDRDVIKAYQRKMEYAKSVSSFCPRNGKIRIVYRKPGEKVFVIDQPRLPMFSLLMHHHGKHRATVDEDYKCTRCGKEVPPAVKALVLAETMTTF